MGKMLQNAWRLSFSLLVAALLGFGLWGCSSGGSDAANNANNANNANATASSTANANQSQGKNTAGNSSKEASPSLTFRSYSLMKSHYEKHGVEMGFTSMEDYVVAANAVVANPKSLHKIEKEDGDDVYYLEETNEFVVVSTDGYLRTYFCPDSGKRYFDKQ